MRLKIAPRSSYFHYRQSAQCRPAELAGLRVGSDEVVYSYRSE
ncbi:hypothetical protein [Porphyromonas levii]|nr:hypothetical protein [Porphyromonas levii]